MEYSEVNYREEPSIIGDLLSYSSLTISSNQSTYIIGLCQSVDNHDAAIIQRKGKTSSILGKLQHVTAIEYGK